MEVSEPLSSPAKSCEESGEDMQSVVDSIKQSVVDSIKTLESARLNTCSFFVYTIDENSELSFLLRSKKLDSKSNGMYTDFGTSLKESEPNILFSAARSFVTKTAGLCV